MTYFTATYWNRGTSGCVNQDSLSLQHAAVGRRHCLMAAVCDGVGGMDRGELASGLALKTLTDWFWQEEIFSISKDSSKELILIALQRQISNIQQSFLQLQRKEHINMGTTLSIVIVSGSRYVWANIGDSRIYRVSEGGTLNMLTEDDTDAAGRLCRCLGASGKDEAFFGCGRLRNREGLLLASDGFHYALRTGRAGIFKATALCRKESMIERRLEILGERGNSDNRSAIYLRREGLF